MKSEVANTTVSHKNSTVPLSRKTRTSLILPKYRQVEDDLRSRISSGQWAVGSMLPGRAALANEYAVDLTTLQRAVSSLLQDGTLRADSRRGTFVANSTRSSAAAPPVIAPSTATVPLSTTEVAGKNRVGIVVAFPHGGEFSQKGDEWTQVMLASVERVFAQRHIETYFINRCRESADPDAERLPLKECIAPLVAEGIYSVLVAGIAEKIALDDEIAECQSLYPEINIVLIGWHAVPFAVPCVYYDSQMAGYQAAQHLLERGHRSIAFFMPWEAPWARQRLEGIRMAVKQAGLPETAVRLLPGGDLPPETQDGARERELAYLAAKKILLADGRSSRGEWAGGITGIIAANDEAALGVQAASVEAGLFVGRNYALMGFDDCTAARQHGLTTMRPPLEALGEEGARLVFRGPGGGDPIASGVIPQVRLASCLVPRASTRFQPQK